MMFWPLYALLRIVFVLESLTMNTVLLFCLLFAGGFVLDDVHGLAMKGGELSATEAASIEKSVEATPDDINARTKLLGYYWRKAISDPAAGASQVKHVLWLVNNAPKSEVLGLPYSQVHSHSNPEGYAAIKKAWQVHLEKESVDLAILKNSSKWFLQYDRALAGEILNRGREITEEEPYWDRELGHLYSLDMIGVDSKKKRRELAAKAFEHFEIAYELSTEESRDSMLQSMARTALAAGKTEEAKKYAQKMLTQQTNDWNSGNNVHHGNTILGRIALADNDIDEAKRRLLAAGETKGSPQLGSFGPSMALAKELLEKGETKVVLEYFELCREFWGMGKEQLDRWSVVVKSGKIPSFGSNINR